MIITLQNMQLQQTLRNVTLAEENLTRKLWKSMKKFAKKFLQKNASNLIFKSNAKPRMHRAKVQKTNTEEEKNLSESRLNLQSNKLSNPEKCQSGNCRVFSLDKLWATIIPNLALRTLTLVMWQVSLSTTELTASGAAVSLMNKQATGTFLSASRSSRQIK